MRSEQEIRQTARRFYAQASVAGEDGLPLWAARDALLWVLGEHEFDWTESEKAAMDTVATAFEKRNKAQQN